MATTKDIPGVKIRHTIPGMAPEGTIPGLVPKGQDPPDMGTEADIPKNKTLEGANQDPQVWRRDVNPDKKFRRII